MLVIINAIPLFTGIFSSNFLIASNPPAEAPIPTIKNLEESLRTFPILLCYHVT